MEERVKNVVEGYRKFFGKPPDVVVSAPGRVNLIGEHTDYNNGLALPFGIGKRVYAAGSKESGEGLKLVSASFPEDINKINFEPIEKNSNWKDYPKGVFWELNRMGLEPGAASIYFESDVPVESGLSSSAAMEVATAGCLNELFGLGVSEIDIAKASQRAENEFVGVKCGLMDQMASALSKQDHALFIDFKDLHYELVPFSIPGHSVVIADSGSKRELASSKYNERRSECGAAAKSLGVKDLREAEDLPVDKIDALPDILHKRARHVIDENARVISAMKALKTGDFNQMGKLMFESHSSLKDLYEVSSSELDCMVETAGEINGVLGSRLTGAGFGGCTISLVKSEASSKFCEILSEKFKARFGREIRAFETTPDNGLMKHGINK